MCLNGGPEVFPCQLKGPMHDRAMCLIDSPIAPEVHHQVNQGAHVVVQSILMVGLKCSIG